MANAEQSMIAPSISPEMRSIFDEHFALVWRYMAQRAVPRDQIDDLVHNVFRVVREHPLRRQDRVRLRVLVCMACFQVFRAYQTGFRSTAYGADDGEEPTENFGESASVMLLDSAIDALSEVEREAYLLCEGEEIPFEEAGAALGITETSLLRKYTRAKREVGGFVANAKGHLLSGESPENHARDLLLAAQARRTPDRADHGRVLTAFIAASITRFGRPVLELSPPTAPQVPLHLPAPQVAAKAEASVVKRAGGALRILLSIFGFGKARWGRRIAWAAAASAVLALWGWNYVMASSTRASGESSPDTDDLAVAEDEESFDEEDLSGDDELADADEAQLAAQDMERAARPTQLEAEVITAEPSESDEDVAAADIAQAGVADPAAAPSESGPSGDAVAAPARPQGGQHEPDSAPEDAVEPGEDAEQVVAEGSAPTTDSEELPEEEAHEASPVQAAATGGRGGAAAPQEKPVARVKQQTAASPQTAARKPAARGASADRQLLRLAGQRVRQGASAAALALLEKHEARFPASRNRRTRSALRAQALCAEGERERAREIALDLESRSAAPSLLQAVGRACL